ncbi:hypothetical protein AMTR_s00003p00233250 [Amborella trichopoda]|uniref:Uncharacterized protein n=1 Tax=Amborella trichopoda TaxID=13333 RepID=W1P6U5_AMBTC|nr:hypothetical protein AMTR_s00003p00233250 [Amborella trichopoda]
MISALSWVPKGVAKVLPDTAPLPSLDEIEELLKSKTLKNSGNSKDEGDDDMALSNEGPLDEVTAALVAADAIGRNSGDRTGTSKVQDITGGLLELDMDHYDDEDEGIDFFGSGSLRDIIDPSNDPYLKDKDDDDEEIEDMRIEPTDAIIICACNEDDVSHLEVHIYEEDSVDNEANLYVHHDIILPAFPLCTEWLDCNLKGGDKGNFIAVGSMEPEIEIWDLDVLDEVKPFMILGGKRKGKKYKEGSHTDAVLGLAWNKEFRNVLASASADKSVKVWDIVAGKCEHTMLHHTDKVQAVAWNRQQATVLLSGSFDHSVVMMDMRTPSHEGIRWSVTADVESLAWDPHAEHSFVVSLEDGTVQGFDIRTATSGKDSGLKPSFTLHAHDKAVCTVSYNLSAPNVRLSHKNYLYNM